MSGSPAESHSGSGGDSVTGWGGESMGYLDLPPPRRRLLPAPVCGAWVAAPSLRNSDVPGPDRAVSWEAATHWRAETAGWTTPGTASGPGAAVPALASVATHRTSLRRGPAERVWSDPARRAAGQCRTHRRVSVGPASPWLPRCRASRERCCCHWCHLSACLDPRLGERSRRGLRVRLLLSAASTSGQHQPCSRANFIAALGRDVLQPDSFWSALEADCSCHVPCLRKRS